MMISTRGRYALRVMLDLAEHCADGYIPLKEIAHRQDISEKYLEIVLKVLVRNNLLTGLRGKGGGYRLSRPSAEYTACQIIETIEGRIAPISCLKAPENTCGRRQFCCTLPMWEQLDHLIRDYLQSVTLKDLAEGALSDLPCSLSSPSNNHVNHQ